MFQQEIYVKIPAELKAYRQFIVWRLEWLRDDPDHKRKPTKIPYMFDGRFADVSKPETWHSFEEVLTAKFGSKEPVEPGTPILQSGFSGIGFVLTENDPFTFVDLDDTKGDSEKVRRQLEIYQTLNSYSERSPSGKGLHIIVRGSVPRGKKRDYVEIYSSRRYMTMTGEVFNDAPIADRHNEVNQIWAQLGGESGQEIFDADALQTEEDAAIIKRASEAENGRKFLDLYSGDWQNHYGPQHGHQGTGHSEADFALINIISFYTQNKEQIKRMFRASNLGKRDKAKRNDYLDNMILRSFDRQIPPMDIENMNARLNSQMSNGAEKWGAVTEAAAPIVAGGLVHATATPGGGEAVQPLLPGLPAIINQPHLDNLPPGLLGRMAHFFYSSSPTPVKEIALAGAIGLMAGITGRCYNVSGAGLNQYVLCLAPTGSGKESLATGISKLMATVKTSVPGSPNFIGPGNIRSDAALLKWLARFPSFVSIVGEFGIRLKQMSSQNASNHEAGLRSVILDLYNKSGEGKVLNPIAYSDKEKNTADIHAPAFTLVGESTPERFYEALDESMIYEGLLPRFTILEYAGEQPRLNKNHQFVKPEFELIAQFEKIVAACVAMNAANKFNHISIAEDAEPMLEDLREFARRETNRADSEIVRQLWSRVYMKTLKLAALVAVGENFNFPTITLANALWAKSLIIADVTNLLRRFNRGDIGKASEESKQEVAVKKVCAEYIMQSFAQVAGYLKDTNVENLHKSRIIPHVYIMRRLSSSSTFRSDPRGVTFAIKRTIQNLIETDILREVPFRTIEQFGTRQKCYMISQWDELNA